MNRFLVQVSKEPGYANITNNRRYQNSLWMNKKRDRDHGEVEAGDELLVYCSSTVPEHSSSLAFSVVVQKVSPDRITFELGDPQWFKSPLKREVIISLVYGLKLPKVFGKCGQTGFQHREGGASCRTSGLGASQCRGGCNEREHTWQSVGRVRQTRQSDG